MGMKCASEDIRNLAVQLYQSGKYTQQEVADIVGYHVNSVKNWLKAAAAGIPQKPRKKGCPPRVLTPEDLDRLEALLIEGKCHNLNELTAALGKGSRSVVHRAIHELGYTYKKSSLCKSKTQ